MSDDSLAQPSPLRIVQTRTAYGTGPYPDDVPILTGRVRRVALCPVCHCPLELWTDEEQP